MRNAIFVTVCAVLLAGLAGCAPRFSPPIQIEPAPAPAPPPPPKVAARLYGEEADALAAYPAFASRSGDALTISFDGKAVARFTDVGKSACEGYETCSVWTFAGLVDIGGALDAAVMRDNGEDVQYVVIDRAGRDIWLSGAFTASPDGRYMATGQNDLSPGGYLEIIDLTSPWPHVWAQSAAPCEPQDWTPPATLNLLCDDGSGPVKATAMSQADGAWKLSPGNWPPPQPQSAGARGADSVKWEHDNGFERLVTP